MKKLIDSKKITVQWSIFIPSIVILLILVTPLVLWEEQSMEAIEQFIFYCGIEIWLVFHFCQLMYLLY